MDRRIPFVKRSLIIERDCLSFPAISQNALQSAKVSSRALLRCFGILDLPFPPSFAFWAKVSIGVYAIIFLRPYCYRRK